MKKNKGKKNQQSGQESSAQGQSQSSQGSGERPVQQQSRGPQQQQGQPGQQQHRGPPGQQQQQGPPGQQFRGPPGQQQQQGPPGQQQGPPGQQQHRGPPGQPQQGQQPQNVPAQQSQGDNRPAKGAWKDKKKQNKGANQDQAAQPGQPPAPQQQQQQQSQAAAVKPQPMPTQQPPQQQPPQQQQQRQRSESVASGASQRSDRSKPGMQKPAAKEDKPQKLDLATKLKQLSLIEANFPVRPSVSKEKNRFRKELISTNYLPLNFTKLPDMIYHYDITFDPDRPKKFMFPAFKLLVRNNLPHLVNKVAFDGVKSFYSMEKIKLTQFPELEVPSPDCGRAKKFKITIQLAAEVDMRIIKQYPNYTNGTHMQQAIQVLDIVLRSAFDRDGLIRHKRSIFAPPTQRIPMQDNYELFIGLFQSFVMGERPYLNVDVSHKAFPSGADNLEPLFRQYQNMDDILRGLNLVYTSPMTGEKKTFKFNSIRGTAERETFEDEQDNNRRKSIAQYFADKGKPLRCPKAPVFHIGPAQRNILIPMEFLSIPPGQALNGKAPESCTRDMVRVAATSTDVRKQKIMDLLRNINYKGVDTIRQFGITVGENFIDVNSHILEPPQLQYKDKVVRINKPGLWEGAPFLEPQSCTKWGILVMDRRVGNNQVNDFGKGFVETARRMGLDFASYDPQNVQEATGRLDKNGLDNIINSLKNKGIELLFVILSSFGDQYQDVKKSAELRCGMLTQCIKSNTINKMNPSTLNNILLKVNSKLGGSNQRIEGRSTVSIDRRPFMVIGADVTHPSPEQQNIPSVVGVAASYDKFAFRYNCQWRIQNPRDETIRDLDQIVEEHLRVFKEKHGRLPMHILYYRDGVSEGQFPEIKEIELTAIKKACQTMGGVDNKILITVIVVQKRHHTRFFPKKPNPLDRKNNNVTPGTVVDSEIVDSNKKWQFFMVAHQSIQGVAKPTKYCIIHDEANVSNEDLQVFTYNLCHLFTRCNRTVSYVAPTYYAHLVAYRGRVYIHNERIDFNNLPLENQRRQVKPEIIQGRPMYFV